MSLQRLIQIAFLFALSPLATGFEGDEHQELSDLSLSIAVDLRCPLATTTNIEKCKKVREAEAALSNYGTNGLTYGKINQVVDYMHYPEMVFITEPSWSSKEELNTHVSELLTRSLDRFVLFDYLSASSHNERHFQFDMMKSMDILHRSAINEARGGRIFHALVFNALSDHYLNDFFAPGHVTTQRENSHDMVSLAMHDWSNRAGSCFKIDWSTELDEVLEFLEGYEKELVKEIKKDTELADANLAECGNTSGFSVVGLSQKELQRATIANLKDNHDTIYLKGDGRLLRNPKQKIFMLIVQVRSIAEVIDSYLNCDGTPACQDPFQAVTDYVWSDSFEEGEIVAPTAEIRYGRYDINNAVTATSVARDEFTLVAHGLDTGKKLRFTGKTLDALVSGDTYYVIKTSDDTFQLAASNTDADAASPTVLTINPASDLTFERDNKVMVRTLGIPVGYRPKYAYPVIADNGFLLSFGGQTLEHEPARFETQLELFPMKIGSAWEVLRNMMAPRPSSQCNTKAGMLCNVGLAYGATYFRGDDLDGTGGQLRIIKAWPKISGHFSVILRRSKYDYADEKSWENAYGIRYDHGFSLHSFYIGFQRDWGLDNNGDFGRENIVTFGWNLTFPSSRFLGFFGGYK